MKHGTNQALFEYWLRRRGARAVPLRRDIEPSDIHRLLPDTFILQCEGEQPAEFRIAGSRICALYGHELKGTPFADLWSGQERETVRASVAAMREEGLCTLIGWQARTATRETLRGETLMLPLGTDRQEMNRVLGTMVPMSAPYWIGMLPVVALSMQTVRMIDPAGAEVRPFGRRRGLPGAAGTGTPVPAHTHGHLTVYLGGRHDASAESADSGSLGSDS